MHNSKRSNLFFSSYLIQQPPAAFRVRLSGKFLRKIARKHNILRENPQDRRAEWWILALKWYSLLKAKNRRVSFFGDYWEICTGFTRVYHAYFTIPFKCIKMFIVYLRYTPRNFNNDWLFLKIQTLNWKTSINLKKFSSIPGKMWKSCNV